MSRNHYQLAQEQKNSVRGTVKLLNAARSRYEGDWHSVPHSHQHMELFYIVGGRGQFLIQGRLYPVLANQLVIINPGILHTEVSLNAQPLEYLVLGIEGIELAVDENASSGFSILEHIENAEITSCMRNTLREMEQQLNGYEEVCQAYTEILIIRLMRSTHLTIPSNPQTFPRNQQCAAVKRYIDQHFKEPLTLEQLAEEVHMDKYYLSHAFKREFGVPPIHYLIDQRIEESKYLLAETDLSLSQIGRLLGFSSLSYFSQVFRRTQKISPAEYRQKAKG